MQGGSGDTRKACDLLIVGAGPAGMQAALVAREAGLSVIVADEGQSPGGQIYRNIMGQAARMDRLLGTDYGKGRALAEAFLRCGADYRAGASVFMLEKQPDDTILAGLAFADVDQASLCSARAVLIATGAQERPFPIPGWTLPGVMTAGAAQTLLKASGLVPDGPLVLAGQGPLLMLLAAQYLRAGVTIRAVLETTPLGNLGPAIRHLPGFLASRYAFKGAALLAEVMRGTRVRWGVTTLEALGHAHLEAVRFRHKGREHNVEAGCLLLHQGVVPQVNLSLSVRAGHVWNATRLAFEPVLSSDGETDVPGLFIAGDTGGIAGADAARASGLVAGLAIARRFGRVLPHHRAAEAVARHDLAAAQRGRAFLDQLYRPADANRKPADDVIVCRCEEVTAGRIRELARRGAQGPNQAKIFSRAGMGPCQSRLCGLTVCELMAEVQGVSPGAVGLMRIRAPVKPVTVGQMARLAD